MNEQRMTLQSVRVRNFKAIVDSRSVRFGPLTAFIGYNGSGKSSLIEALETTLPAVWRRVEDHRRHRRARADCQDTHAPGLACARAAALTGVAAGVVPGGLIRKARTVLQQRRRSGSAGARAKRSNCVEISPSGRCGDRRIHARGEFSANTAQWTAQWTAMDRNGPITCRAGDMVGNNEKGGLKCLFSGAELRRQGAAASRDAARDLRDPGRGHFPGAGACARSHAEIAGLRALG